MARMLVSGLMRTFFSGRIILFRNQPEPVFKVERASVEEVFIGDFDRHNIRRFKYEAANYIEACGFDIVAYLDSDCAVLPDVNHLWPEHRSWDVIWLPERGQRISCKIATPRVPDIDLENEFRAPVANRAR